MEESKITEIGPDFKHSKSDLFAQLEKLIDAHSDSVKAETLEHALSSRTITELECTKLAIKLLRQYESK